ncbi:MAG TPA: hypothetical protein PLS23_22445 [Phycisphaerae bacterium]|nr:hypothetical protein [Phycisphaerae bacterium]
MDNPIVVTHLNSTLRPVGELLREVQIRLRSAYDQNQQTGGAGELIYQAAMVNGNEPIEDGRTDVPAVTCGRAEEFRLLIKSVLDILEAEGKSALIAEFCVRSIQQVG